MTDLYELLDSYDPNWHDNFATVREAAEHFGLEHMLESADTGESYEELNFDDDPYVEYGFDYPFERD